MSNEDMKVDLETEQLDLGTDSPPANQPVVVIQYRNRGLPWYLLLPLLILFSGGAVGVYHFLIAPRFRFHSRSSGPAIKDPGQSREGSGGLQATSNAGEGKTPKLSPILEHTQPLPLSLNSQPIVPGSIPLTPPVGSIGEAVKSKAGDRAAHPSPNPAPELAAAKSDPASPSPAPVLKGAGSSTTPPAPHDSKPSSKNSLAVGFVPPEENSPFEMFQPARPEPPLPEPDRHDTLPTTGPQNDPPTLENTPKLTQRTPTPEDVPNPSKEEVLRNIKAEAAEKQAELNQLQDLKNRAWEESLAESQARLREQRVKFRRELLKILRSGSHQTGREIDDLCNTYGRSYDSQLRADVTSVLSRIPGKMSPEAKVNLLRLYGIPEPGILDFLANDFHRYINSRNGPRDSDQVRVSAARQLLRFKLPADSSTFQIAKNRASRAPRHVSDPGSAPATRPQ
jgi:hypothetical protein